MVLWWSRRFSRWVAVALVLDHDYAAAEKRLRGWLKAHSREAGKIAADLRTYLDPDSGVSCSWPRKGLIVAERGGPYLGGLLLGFIAKEVGYIALITVAVKRQGVADGLLREVHRAYPNLVIHHAGFHDTQGLRWGREMASMLVSADLADYSANDANVRPARRRAESAVRPGSEEPGA